MRSSRPGERILDLCAAPGGKTAQIVQALSNRGTVVANDGLASRVRALRANLDRLGALNVSTTVYDGGNYPRAAGHFERVLVDAPCSGEGMLRKQSRSRSGNVPLYQRYAREQQALLIGAAARSNFVELGREQMGAYVTRLELELAPGQLEACTGSGYVLVRYRGFGLGLGYLDTAKRRLESLFPKRWMGGIA